ncbi:cytochrome P450 [Glutamicibacter protophormiae]|uniref:cytochrome P450 n=2 Tax=Micrococcaceae TaxID=1268 RepID=UPI002A840957|nr:cytochrome P450 [Glutamicibacter protophormiae]WPR64458.1 cytochrome P450 [Glutamicibacter protophormiae]WPR67952.1 cytochrome P450 [Glutamicibacter protophormiae]
MPHFDISSPDFAMQSEEVRNARESSWYATTNYGLAVLQYEHVAKLLKSPKLIQGSAKWPAHNGVHSGLFFDWWTKNLLVLEGEDHHRIRRLLNPAFSPRMVKGLRPRFQALANELIDAFIDKGECDVITDFAEPYATRVLTILLGIDESEWPTIARLASTVGLALGVTFKQDLVKVESAVAELYEYAEALIRDRQSNPGDDFMSKLVLANRDGDSLTDEELRNAVVLLIFGGMDTTRNQIGLAFQSFMRYPEQWDLLAERPDLGGKAVEEVMRTNPTVTWVTREAVETFEHNGLVIEKGTTVHLFTQTSGTDPQAFPNPELDLLGEHPPHYGFGGGVHHCLGHFIARADMSEALPLIASRITNMRLNGQDEWMPDSGNTGPIKLPIAFDRR